MLLACIFFGILSIALPSLRIFSLLRVVTIMLFYTALILFIIVYIQSIGSGMDVYSELFNNKSVLVLFSSLMPVKPNKLTQAEQDSFLLSKELKQKLGFENEISDTWFKWFIGFAEGDGAILSYQGQPQFVITQKEGKILKKSTIF